MQNDDNFCSDRHSRTSIKMMKFLVIFFVLGSACAEMPTVWVDCDNCTTRIIKGQDANEGEFPYMVSLRKKLQNNGHSCGGSILTKNWVLTAAHCCDGRNQNSLILYSGSIHLDKGGTYHPVERIIMHEDYQPALRWRNDVCLIRVSQPFTFGPQVQQITLPPQNWPVNHGDKLTVSGWGLTNPYPPQEVPNRMQKSDIFSALGDSQCASETGVNMFNGYLCARGGIQGQGVCNGDSGGPLVKNKVQVGVVSWGFRPCGCGKPDFFARVPTYINWIKGKLGSEASELKFLK